MKKKALLISDEIFLSYSYNEGIIESKDNKIVKTLNKKFDIDNISTKNIDSLKASNYIKQFIKTFDYSYCIISLTNIDDNIKEAIDELSKLKIKIIFVEAPNASKEELNKIKNFDSKDEINYITYDDVKEPSASKINSLFFKICA